MKKILGMIVIAFLFGSCGNNQEKEEIALNTIKKFEVFGEKNLKSLFDYNVNDKRLGGDNYIVSFSHTQKLRRIAFSQWYVQGELSSEEFCFLYSYSGKISFDNVVVLCYSKPGMRRQRYELMSLREVKQKEEEKYIIRGERKKFFLKELSFHLLKIMDAHEDSINFIFEMDTSFLKNEYGL